jgi:hypothetical protein
MCVKPIGLDFILCHRLREQLVAFRTDPEQLVVVQSGMRQHLSMVRIERYSYRVRRNLPVSDPSIVSIVIDAADQAAFDLPHFAQATHSSQKMRIGLKVIGAIAHGHGEKYKSKLSYFSRCLWVSGRRAFENGIQHHNRMPQACAGNV